MAFPVNRPRRLRRSELHRRLVRETKLSVDDLVLPLFVREGTNVCQPIKSMPGCAQMSIDVLVEEAKAAAGDGLPGVILFGIPDTKDATGSSGYASDGIVQRAVRAIKQAVDNLLVITDVCLCEYTDHGHCGIIADGDVDNDRTLEFLARMAVSHAQAGADIVAPSDMMDGRVGVIREALDGTGFSDTAIMAYSAKYASSFYGPFRDAAESPPKFGDRRSYQMDFANSSEALREVALDLGEGADIVMVKPAMAYLDIVRMIKDEFGGPVAAYNVSGEYAMVKAAAEKGWIDEKQVAMETLVSMKRAGADIILTYWARQAAAWLKEE